MMSLFKPKPTPPTLGPINEDWKAGDLAVCIIDGEWYGAPPHAPRQRQTLRVADVFLGRCAQTGKPDWGLRFVGFDGAYAAEQFRKLPPASDEFITRIRACKPHIERVPA